jgi:hypothetical protein
MKEPGGRLNTPEPEKLHVADEVLTWAGSSGADLLIRFCVGKVARNGPFAVPQLLLRSLDMAMISTNTEAWDTLSARDIATAVRSARQPGSWQGLFWGAPSEHTFLFRTRQGNAGILLVTGFNDKPRSVKLFYKLVRPAPAATPPARAQAGVSPGSTSTRLASALQFRWVASADETTAPAEVLADPNDRSGQRKLRVLKEVVLDGSAVAQMGWHPGLNPRLNGAQMLVLRWNNAGRQRFAELTAANIHRQLAVVFEGRVLTAPNIAGAIDTSNCELAAIVTEAEMKRMLACLSGEQSGTGESQFGPTHELVLPQRPRTGKDLVFLNLVTQRWMTNSTSESGSREFHEWVHQNGADLSGGTDTRAFQDWLAQVNPTAAAAEPAPLPMAFCYNTVVLPAETNAWDSATPFAVRFRWELAAQEPEKETMIGKLAGHPDTYYVRTHDNGYGLLQIIGFTDNPRGVRIRYKMVQDLATTPAAPAAARRGVQTAIESPPATNLSSAASTGDANPLSAEEKAAVSAAQAWLSLIDQGNYSASWKEAEPLFQARITEESWETTMTSFRTPLGNLLSRKLKSAQRMTAMPGAPDGQYVIIQFQTSFANKKAASETVTVGPKRDGMWKAGGYYIK